MSKFKYHYDVLAESKVLLQPTFEAALKKITDVGYDAPIRVGDKLLVADADNPWGLTAVDITTNTYQHIEFRMCNNCDDIQPLNEGGFCEDCVNYKEAE